MILIGTENFPTLIVEEAETTLLSKDWNIDDPLSETK